MLRKDGLSRASLAAALLLLAGVGAAAALLVKLGNPGNMGICGACFLRDLAGALGLSQGAPKIFRPEVAGLLLGAMAWRAARGRFEARSGGFAVARFLLGVLMGLGALVFLGCPFRMLQRIGGGDLNAILGLLGFVPGVGIGLYFERRGYSIGRTAPAPRAVGLLGPVVALLLLGLFLLEGPLLGPRPGQAGAPAHADWKLSLGLALAAGAALSATGFCAVSAARQVFSGRKTMLFGAGLLVLGYAAVALAAGTFRLGAAGQPIAHTDALWNVLSLLLVGLCGALAGGCPVRQMVMAGEGNGDAFVAVLGIVTGGALAHNLGIVSSAAGATAAGRWTVAIGIVASVAYAASIARASRAPSAPLA